ncbi:MAG: M48 family peptidase, partial [Akkermansiaceae bacterium]|nr:M48 family peptidase [Akkermansiaceae bacterium]
ESQPNYLRVNARFGIIQSTVSLLTLLVFWTLGGFGWLDGLARSFSTSPVVAGLIFLSLLISAKV